MPIIYFTVATNKTLTIRRRRYKERETGFAQSPSSQGISAMRVLLVAPTPC
jgi:hypothetical protein